MKKNIWSGFWLVAVLLLFSCLSANGQNALKSGCEIDYPPFCMVPESGKAAGFSVDLLDSVLAIMGQRVEYVTGEWQEIKQKLESGGLDVLPLVGRTPEREETMDFTIPYMTLHGAVVVRKSEKDIVSIHDLKGREVAVMQADNAHEFLLRNDLSIKIVTYPTFAQALAALDSGRHDAVISQKFIALKLIKENNFNNLKILRRPVDGFHQDFCFAVPEGNKQLLALLNEGLSRIFANGTYDVLHARWFASLEIEEQNEIIVGSDIFYPPFEFLNENGVPVGFNYDLISAVASATGIRFAFKPDKWPKTLTDLETGKIDMIQGMFFSPQRATRFSFSTPIMVSHCVAVVRKGKIAPPSSPAELKNLRIVVEDQDIMHEFVTNHGFASQTTIVSSQIEALQKLEAGDFDCALVSRMTAAWAIKKYAWDSLEMATDPLLSPKYCFATRQSRKGLLAKLNEGLKIVEQSGEYYRIQEKWFGVSNENKRQYERVFRYLFLITAPLLVAVILFFFWSYSLKQQVLHKTEQLRKSEAQFRELIEGAPYAIFVQTQGVFAYLNQEAARLLGVANPEEMLGKPVIDIYQPEDHLIVSQRIFRLDYEKMPTNPQKNKVIRQDQTLIPVEISAVPTRFADKEGALVFMRDISEQIKLEEQLRQTSKMEAIGHLAGGVAHDYNNMLSVILGYVEIMLATTPESDSNHKYLQDVLNAAKRSAEITSQLLAFARRQAISPRFVNINQGVENILKMLTRLIGESIVLTWQPGENIPDILIDPVQLDQILTNLCVNARDAISGNGEIVINTRLVDDETELGLFGAPAGSYVFLAVADNGCGMTDLIREKIFEPFFTTKELGRGTGLGLATVYGIVKQNHGFIRVQSTPPTGTSFEIIFPVSESPLPHSEPSREKEIIRGRQNQILLVEDEEAVLKLTKKILEGLNYRVVAANSPSQAVNLVKDPELAFDLVISDVIMPEMNGKELYERIKEIRPGINVLFISGYSADIIGVQGLICDSVNFLEKPFTISRLSEKVRHALGNKS